MLAGNFWPERGRGLGALNFKSVSFPMAIDGSMYISCIIHAAHLLEKEPAIKYFESVVNLVLSGDLCSGPNFCFVLMDVQTKCASMCMGVRAGDHALALFLI